jgi:hypothetical protein
MDNYLDSMFEDNLRATLTRKLSNKKDPILEQVKTKEEIQEEDKEIEEADELSKYRESQEKIANSLAKSLELFNSLNKPTKEIIEDDKPVYGGRSIWVELKNEEGDIVWLNRETGETSLKKPKEEDGASK